MGYFFRVDGFPFAFFCRRRNRLEGLLLPFSTQGLFGGKWLQGFLLGREDLLSYLGSMLRLCGCCHSTDGRVDTQ